MLTGDRRLLTRAEVLDLTAVVIPAYFSPSVAEARIRNILDGVVVDAEFFCRPDRLAIVVDGGSHTESVLDAMGGLNLVRLERNRGKAGAVAAGLEALLRSTDAGFFATRDCDGDHLQEDLPRLVSLAASMRETTGNPMVCAMGARPSLAKPMGWVREQWEQLTNRVLVDLASYVLARKEQVLDRRFWNGMEPDLQSGYRVYSREAAEVAVECLNRVPDQPGILTFACEFVPFAELTERGGLFGQAQRLTLVEQPVSSYSAVDYAGTYGWLLGYLADEWKVSRSRLLRLFDNHLGWSALYFSNEKESVERGRRILYGLDDPPAAVLPGFV